VVEVRGATVADEEPLVTIDRVTWTAVVTPAPVPDDGSPFFNEKTRPENVLVAVEDGEVAGYVKLGRVTELAASDHVLMITGIAVDPGRQGRGIGRALIDAAVGEARRRGARRLTLRVLGGNAGARHLYETSGFVVEGVLRGEFLMNGVYVDDVLMALDLG
jgi:ribosomal protein S18 acetylase RimI-like enzyme